MNLPFFRYLTEDSFNVNYKVILSVDYIFLLVLLDQRNQKFIISLDSFPNQRLIYFPNLYNTSLCIDYPLESCKFKVILFGSMLQNLEGH